MKTTIKKPSDLVSVCTIPIPLEGTVYFWLWGDGDFILWDNGDSMRQ